MIWLESFWFAHKIKQICFSNGIQTVFIEHCSSFQSWQKNQINGMIFSTTATTKKLILKNSMKSFEKPHDFHVGYAFPNAIWLCSEHFMSVQCIRWEYSLKTWINERIKIALLLLSFVVHVHRICAIKKHNSDLKVKVSRQKRKKISNNTAWRKRKRAETCSEWMGSERVEENQRAKEPESEKEIWRKWKMSKNLPERPNKQQTTRKKNSNTKLLDNCFS